jgi:ABC-type dipeptide/oligopeptide/nickel transport system permease subunit
MTRTGRFFAALLIGIVLISLFAPVISHYDPNAIDLDSLREPPGCEHLLGTDNKGRDVLARILYGGRISLGISATAAFISLLIGLILGLCSGYFGGKVDLLIMASVDLVLSFPALLLAIAISILFPAGIYTVVIAIVAVGWASFARIIRAQVLTFSEASFIEAARSIGCSHLRILFRHLLPQCIPVLLVMAGMKMGSYILTESALSFLGLGAQPPTATWGSMISANRVYISSAPWMVLFPGCMIALTVLCCNMLGDAMRDKYGISVKERN